MEGWPSGFVEVVVKLVLAFVGRAIGGGERGVGVAAAG